MISNLRVVTYSRYSSDNQRETSITDQQRICREHADSRGWQVIHDDEALLPPRALLAEGERFRPHRSTVALLCYHAVHVARGTTPAP